MEKPTAADAAAYRNGTPGKRLTIAPASSSAHRQIQPARPEGDEKQPEQEADCQRTAASRQGDDQHRQAEADDRHRKDADRELIPLVGGGTSVHRPQLRPRVGFAIRSRPQAAAHDNRSGLRPSLRMERPGGRYSAMIGMIRIATMFATLIIGLIAGPAVSL